MILPDWRKQAVCAGSDPQLWHAEDDESFKSWKTRQAELLDAYCQFCPVRAVCVAEAISCGDWHGVRGVLELELRECVAANWHEPQGVAA